MICIRLPKRPLTSIVNPTPQQVEEYEVINLFQSSCLIPNLLLLVLLI